MSQETSIPLPEEERNHQTEQATNLTHPTPPNSVVIDQRGQQVLGNQTNIIGEQQLFQPAEHTAIISPTQENRIPNTNDNSASFYIDQGRQSVVNQIILINDKTNIEHITQGGLTGSSQVSSGPEAPMASPQPMRQIQVCDGETQKSEAQLDRCGNAPTDAQRSKPLFVNRKELIEAFHGLLIPQSTEWLLVIGGTPGSGKTAALTFLQQQAIASQVKTVFVNLAEAQTNPDPLALLDMLEYLLADRLLPAVVYQTYKQRRQIALDALAEQRAQIINQLIIVSPGPVTIGQIYQTDSNKGEALYQARRAKCNELTRELLTLMTTALAADPAQQVLILVDHFEILVTTIHGQASAHWFVQQFLTALYQNAKTQVRVVLADNNAWQEGGPWLNHQVIRSTLGPLTKAYVQEYLNARLIQAKDLQHAIWELTRGHSLCMAMAADLCLLAPTTSAQQLRAFIREPFDSEEIADQLYQALVQAIPDAALQRLLRYGPVIRLIDVTVLREVLIPALDLKERATELWQSLRDLAVIEGSQQLRFKPAIRKRQMDRFRHSPHDEHYYALNRLALRYFNQRADQATSVTQRQVHNIELLYHDHNIQPRRAQRHWRESAAAAATELDHVHLANLLTLAQSSDFGWALPEENQLDQGNIKEGEARYYQLIGQEAEAEKSWQAAQKLFHNATRAIDTGQQLTPPEPAPLQEHRKSDLTLSTDEAAQQQFAAPISILAEDTSAADAALRPSLVAPPTAEVADLQGQSWFSFAGMLKAATALVALTVLAPVHWVIGAQTERRRTAPLRRLKQLSTQLQRILAQIERIQSEIDNALIPELQRVETTVGTLNNEVNHRVLPGLEVAKHSAELLSQEIEMARQQQAPDGTITLVALHAIDQGITYGNEMLRQFHQELATLRRTQMALRHDLNKAEQRQQKFAASLQTYEQEHAALRQAAQVLVEEKLTNSNTSGLHPDEIAVVTILYDEIHAYSQQFSLMQQQLHQAFQRYDTADTTADYALNQGSQSLAKLNQAIADLNHQLAQFDGIHLTARDDHQIQTLAISIIHEHN